MGAILSPAFFFEIEHSFGSQAQFKHSFRASRITV